MVVIGDAEEARGVADLLTELLEAVRQGHTPSVADAVYALEQSREGDVKDLGDTLSRRHTVLRRDLPIRPRTRGQKHYLDCIKSSETTLAIGPAGTGKTYLAMAAAVSALLNREVRRLILTRPAVEAGERLGFLPGDLEQKVNPYLRPLYDALFSMIGVDKVRRLVDEERIEVAPLAFMRGRTLDQAFIILDEAQNTTTDQMMMFLTRLGENSKAVVTGDVTQVDLPPGQTSGLIEAERILADVPGISVVRLSRSDVVRNPLVQRIIEAYEADRDVAALPPQVGTGTEGNSS